MTPYFMAFFGVIIIIIIWGVGVVENVFRLGFELYYRRPKHDLPQKNVRGVIRAMMG